MDKVDVAIITGSSGGLGLAITQKLLSHGFHVMGVARSNPNDLEEISDDQKGVYRHVSFDISELNGTHKVLGLIFDQLNPASARSIHLINNAGTIEPLGPMGTLAADEIQQSVNLNLMAPLLWSCEFLKRTAKWDCDRRIIQISSALAARGLAGAAPYCISKAGLEAMTRQLAEEGRGHYKPAVAVSFRPGMIDTSMQEVMRQASRESLPQVDYFKTAFEMGEVRSPEMIATAFCEQLLLGAVRSGATYQFNGTRCEIL